MKVFLSYHYDEPGEAFARKVDRLLNSHHVEMVTGRTLGGGELSDTVRERIDGCDALIALLTKRDDETSSNRWVRDEYIHAKATIKQAFAVYEEGVDTSGMASTHEYAIYDPEDAVDTLLKISDTIGLWTQQMGYSRLALVLPEELARKTRVHEGVACSYRTMMPTDSGPGNWIPTSPTPLEYGGLQVLVSGLKKSQLVQLRMNFPNEPTWTSEFTGQTMRLTLDESRG